MTTDKEELLGRLERLGDEDFKRFKWFLYAGVLDGFPAIPKCRLEKAAREDTVDQVVQTYSHNALGVTEKVFMKMQSSGIGLKGAVAGVSAEDRQDTVDQMMQICNSLHSLGETKEDLMRMQSSRIGPKGAVAGGGAMALMRPITHRQCSIDITNGCSHHTLCNPRTYLSSGRCSIPLSPTVDPSTSERALFIRTPHTMRGSVGVFTYDLLNNHTKRATEKIAVMFHVPFGYNLSTNCYAVGIFHVSKKCDNNLYRDMYLNKEMYEYVRGDAQSDCNLTYKSHGVTIIATMSDAIQSVMKVQVTDKE